MPNKKEWPKAYDASSVEDAMYETWEASGFFNPDQLPDRNQNGEPFCIMMPPPNVTGVLHLGHALEDSLMDTMIRFQRMRGRKALLLPGTDHAAIATQAKVEKRLIEEGIKNPRQELGREKLVEEIRTFAEKSKATILSQIRKMGTSCDWSRLAYTFDEARSKAVNKLFVRMYNDGLIYRGYRVVNWSVKGQSTSSDDEIIYVERPGKLYTFKYAKDFPISISTTRPETKFGDTAVAVHPDDARYKEYIGKTLEADFCGKTLSLKIIADEAVDPDYGTGALGVTPAHSMTDADIAERHGLPIIPVIDERGRMMADCGAEFADCSVEEAREKVIAKLRDQGLLEHKEEVVQNVGTSDRYGVVIEVIPMTQWWLDVNKVIPSRGKSLRELMREAVTIGLDGDSSKKTAITPDRFTKLYLDRVDHLRDWCLSRQLWWGHRIPVWSRGEEIYVGTEAPGGDGWEQDPDTLDTWFSSGSWCFSTLGWPEKTEDLKIFHPTSWMTMGYEILYLWLMRMILMSAYALEDIPFKDAYIHGILRDENGRKFSKSAGTGIDPIEVIKEYGCDALRISLLIGITPGNDSRYFTEKIESGRNFVNKLWNISRFILIQMEDPKQKSTGERTLADEWILSRLADVSASMTEKLEAYQFSQAGEALRDFTWNDLADWYLEIAKVEQGKAEILQEILLTILKLWHPFMPFVTEYIWKLEGSSQDSLLMVAPWPELVNASHGEVALFETLREIVTTMRRLRAENHIEPAKAVAFAIDAEIDVEELVGDNLAWIKRLTNASAVEPLETIPEDWAVAALGSTKLGLNVAGAIDVEKEKTKLHSELQELAGYISTTEKKLQNADFINKAPEQVVATMSEKLAEAKQKEEALQSRSNLLT